MQSGSVGQVKLLSSHCHSLQSKFARFVALWRDVPAMHRPFVLLSIAGHERARQGVALPADPSAFFRCLSSPRWVKKVETTKLQARPLWEYHNWNCCVISIFQSHSEESFVNVGIRAEHYVCARVGSVASARKSRLVIGAEH